MVMNNLHSNKTDIVSQTIHDHTPTIGAIDLGTNSCRLLIASINIINLHRNFFKLRGVTDRSMKIIDSFAKVVGLGEGVKQTGLLSKNAIDRTLEALATCKRKLDFHQVSALRAIATEACRQAENAYILIERAKNEIGINLEIITPQEEAQLVLHGCIGVISDEKPYGILLDIGGGSTEVIWLRISKNKQQNHTNISVIDSMSLPYGVVTLRDTYIHQSHNPEIYKTAQRAITQAMDFFITKNNIAYNLKKDQVQIVASSGTATTLAALVLNLKEYDRHVIDSQIFESTKLQKAGNTILEQYLQNHQHHITLEKNQELLLTRLRESIMYDKYLHSPSFMYARIGLLVAGTVIFSSIMDAIGPQNIKIADRGVREGILHDIIAQLRNGDFPY